MCPNLDNLFITMRVGGAELLNDEHFMRVAQDLIQVEQLAVWLLWYTPSSVSNRYARFMQSPNDLPRAIDRVRPIYGTGEIASRLVAKQDVAFKIFPPNEGFMSFTEMDWHDQHG